MLHVLTIDTPNAPTFYVDFSRDSFAGCVAEYEGTGFAMRTTTVDHLIDSMRIQQLDEAHGATVAAGSMREARTYLSDIGAILARHPTRTA